MKRIKFFALLKLSSKPSKESVPETSANLKPLLKAKRFDDAKRLKYSIAAKEVYLNLTKLFISKTIKFILKC